MQNTVKPLYTGHLVIADRFSKNRPNLDQTLVANPLYSGHYFKESCYHLPWIIPLHKEHTNFWVNPETVIKQVRDFKKF